MTCLSLDTPRASRRAGVYADNAPPGGPSGPPSHLFHILDQISLDGEDVHVEGPYAFSVMRTLTRLFHWTGGPMPPAGREAHTGGIVMKKSLLAVAGIALILALGIPGLDAMAGENVKVKVEKKACDMDVQACLSKMVQSLKSRGWVGIEMDVDGETHAMIVKKVIPGSPAEAAGLMTGDVLTALNGVPFGSKEEKMKPAVKDKWVPGATIEYTLTRAGKELKVPVTLAPLPPDVMAQWVGMHMMDHAQTEVAKK